MESLVPLRAKSESGAYAPIDLDLIERHGGFEPRNDLVDTRLPGSAAGSLSLGSGLAVRVAGGDADSLPARTGGRLFYANALEGASTDLMLVPHPDGVELLFHIRAADSPERYVLELDLPPRARLERGGQGSARVVQDGEVLTTIAPPVAWDADDEQVPVAYEVDGQSLVVEADHHGRDMLYPLIVDPLFKEDQSWRGAPSTDYTGWRRRRRFSVLPHLGGRETA